MTVKAILSRKGTDVVTADPNATLGEVVRVLSARRIGAVVVTGADRRIVGILSERDVVRVLGRGWGKRDWIEHDPDYDILRDDPRFKRLLARLK